MAQRSIEEVFRTIAPSRRRGIPNPSTIGDGFTGVGDANSAFSQVGAEIAQLRAVYQQQRDLITANTKAIQNNTSAKGAGSVASTVGHVAAGLFGGALGLLSPVVNGLLSLFKGGSSAPAPLPVYTAPPPIALSGSFRAQAANVASPSPGAPSTTQNVSTTQTTYSPQITVHVNAMDSQSFMDRSSDIANAVRQAMLNNHPINGVVTGL